MKFILTLLGFIITISIGHGQVAIGTEDMDGGVMLQLESEDKGISIPNVDLTSVLDNTTISPSPTEGMLVYNTGFNGAGTNSVSPGFYNWDGLQWRRLYNTGFTKQFNQSNFAHVLAQGIEYQIPGLVQTLVAPYSGLYQFILVGYYGSGSATVGNAAGGYASFKLYVNGNLEGEKFISSRTLDTGGASFQVLQRQSVMIVQLDLVEGQSYDIEVTGTEWHQENSHGTIGLGTGYGYFGLNSEYYAGSNGRTGAAHSTLVINLLQQY